MWSLMTTGANMYEFGPVGNKIELGFKLNH